MSTAILIIAAGLTAIAAAAAAAQKGQEPVPVRANRPRDARQRPSRDR